MALTTLAALSTALNKAQHCRINKTFSTQKGAGTFQSGWTATGTPGAGATPPAYTVGSGYTCDKSTTGALALFNASATNWLARARLATSQIGTLIIADRLWACSGMGFAASTYTVTTPGSLPARITDSGVGCELWIENYVAQGAVSGTLTADYLDSAGSSQSATLDLLASGPALGQMQQMPMANNLGISQLTDVVNSATWSSNTWGMTILKRVAAIPVPAVTTIIDWSALGIPPVATDACLMFIWFSQNTVAPFVFGSIDLVDL